jgi:hypothetical protein
MYLKLLKYILEEDDPKRNKFHARWLNFMKNLSRVDFFLPDMEYEGSFGLLSRKIKSFFAFFNFFGLFKTK